MLLFPDTELRKNRIEDIRGDMVPENFTGTFVCRPKIRNRAFRRLFKVLNISVRLWYKRRRRYEIEI